MGNDVTDELLARTFSRYPSFQKARVVRDRRTMKTRGFGFVSFKDPADFIRATKELNGITFFFLNNIVNIFYKNINCNKVLEIGCNSFSQ